MYSTLSYISHSIQHNFWIEVSSPRLALLTKLQHGLWAVEWTQCLIQKKKKKTDRDQTVQTVQSHSTGVCVCVFRPQGLEPFLLPDNKVPAFGFEQRKWQQTTTTTQLCRSSLSEVTTVSHLWPGSKVWEAVTRVRTRIRIRKFQLCPRNIFKDYTVTPQMYFDMYIYIFFVEGVVVQLVVLNT